MNRTTWIVRHALREDSVHPDWVKTAERPWDSPLAKEGFAQAEKLAKRLKNTNIAHLISSPFLRALQTSDCLAKVLGIPVIVDTGLGEWGNAQTNIPSDGTPNRHKINKMFPNIHSFRDSVVPSYPIESENALCNRMQTTMKAILQTYHKDILIVTHSSPLIVLLRDLDTNSFDRLCEPGDTPLTMLSPKVPVCSLSKFVKAQNGWNLEYVGNLDHLSD